MYHLGKPNLPAVGGKRIRVPESKWSFLGYVREDKTPWTGKVTFNPYASPSIKTFEGNIDSISYNEVKISGKGVLIYYVDGFRYEADGTIVDNALTGKGKLTANEICVFRGNFVNGLLNDPNGSMELLDSQQVFTGSFVDNKMDGEVTCKSLNETSIVQSYTGIYKDNMLV